MTDGDRESSGELSSFLHLTGFRPLILMLVAGIAGAAGLYFALGEPAQWVARYVVNGQRVADDDLQPAELDIFVEEIARTMKLPVVVDEVERTTGLVDEEDYELSANQAPASIALIDVNVVANSAEESQTVAIETSIVALRTVLEDTRAGLQATRDQLQSRLTEADARSAELVSEAGGVNPTTAYNRAAGLLLERQDFLNNRPTQNVIDDDGTVTVELVPEPEPPIEELRSEVDRLAPIDSEYRQLQAEINELNVKLGERLDSIREATGSINALDDERTDAFVIREVVTEEASRISSLLTGLLLYAVPAALAMILLFVLYDLVRPKPQVAVEPADPYGSAGVLDPAYQAALPEGTRLVIVDEERKKSEAVMESDILATDDSADEAEDDEPRPAKSKASRWGRDASSKAV